MELLKSTRSFNLDRTFCSGARCNKRESCDRYIGLVRDYAKVHPEFIEGRRLSLAEFSNHDGKCKIEVKNEK